jgi:ATP-dependent DNA helicase RecG
MSKLELAKGLGYKTVTGNLKRSMENLITKGIIEYTIPDKPTSKNQKYKLSALGLIIFNKRLCEDNVKNGSSGL